MLGAQVPTAALILIAVALTISGSAAQSLNGRRAAAKLLANSSIAGIVQGIRAGSFSCEDVITEQLRRIEAYGNSTLKAFISVNAANAMALAKSKDQQGVAGSLHCVPVVVKDNIDVVGVPTTSGSRALQSMTAVQDGEIVTRIKSFGGIIIGKSNMAEMSDSGVKSSSTLGGVCANPWDTRRSCLGSSGGSGAAVAAGLAVIGIGTDTEGSVIGPCTASGLLCLRPTQGGVFETMRTGVYPAFSRQDLVGIMAKSKADYLTAHDAIYGVDYTKSVGDAAQLNGVKIRFLDNFYESFELPGIGNYVPDSEVVRLHNLTAQRLTDLGAQVERYKISLGELISRFSTIIAATSTKPKCSDSCLKKSLDGYLSRYTASGPFREAKDLLTVESGFPTSYQTRLKFTVGQKESDVCGPEACSAYEIARHNITSIMQELRGDASALAMLYVAKLPQLNTDNVGVLDEITPAMNPWVGWPSISLPVGFSTSSGSEQPQGMPVSLVLLATNSQEELLLRIASAFLNRYADIRTPSATPELTVKGAVGRQPVGFVAALCMVAAGRMLIEF